MMDTQLALGTCPAILEWLESLPESHRVNYCERAAVLLSACDGPQGIGAVLRVVICERRLAAWAIVVERKRRVSRKRHESALRDVAAAERDLVRAWADYRSARAPVMPVAPQRTGAAPDARSLI